MAISPQSSNVKPQQFIRHNRRVFPILECIKAAIYYTDGVWTTLSFKQKCFPILKRQFIKQTEFGQYYQLNKNNFHYSNVSNGAFYSEVLFLFPKQSQLFPKTCFPNQRQFFPKTLMLHNGNL